MKYYALITLAVASIPALAAETALEQRVRELEQLVAQQKNPPVTNTNAFNPAISLILSGTYAAYQDQSDDYALPGFSVGEESLPKPAGFYLGESELTLSANIDDKFFGQTTIAFANEDGETIVEAEEAFIQTSSLYDGLTIKAGRFLSNIGYLNAHHAHTDAFIDRPLVYQTFFDHHFGDDGVQFRLVLPTDTYIEIGGEFLRGSSYPAAGASKNGKGANTQFIKFGNDVGVGGSYLVGFSHLFANSTDAVERETENELDLFNGEVKLNIIDATYKWSPQGNKRLGQWIARSEWMQERRKGALSDIDHNATSWNSKRAGYYVELQHVAASGWEIAIRHDQLKPDAQAPSMWGSDQISHRNTVMGGWRNSEFSRIQLQLSRGEIANGDLFSAILLQYQMSIGAHGAHKF